MGNRYVCFEVGSGRYGIPVEYVVQIIRYDNITDIPIAPPFVEGVLNLSGEVIPVINVRERFGLSKGGLTELAKKNRVIVVRNEQRSYGLLVDGVREVIELNAAQVKSAEALETESKSAFGIRLEFVMGIAGEHEDLLVILDIFKILSSPADVSVSE